MLKVHQIEKRKHFSKRLTHLYKNRITHQAEAVLKNAVEADPQFQNAYILLAGVSKVQKKYKDSKSAYQKALLINKNVSPEVIYGLAEVEFATQEYDKAKHHFNDFFSFRWFI